MFFKKKSTIVSYDPDRQYPVIRSSICTGEKVAGFKDKDNGHFTDVMLIKSESDMDNFKRLYGLEGVHINVEY